MARTVNSEEVREAFSRRLQEELDRVGFQRSGRGTALAREVGVSHTTTNSWLSGSMPAVGVLVDICKKLGMDFTYLCTGERSGRSASSSIDPDLFRSAVSAVNRHIGDMGCAEEIGIDRLGILYMRAYIALEGDAKDEDLLEDVRLAAGR